MWPRPEARREPASGEEDGVLPGVLLHALTLSGMPSQSRQRGSTERVPSSRQAAPLGERGGGGSAHPLSASERAAFVWLHPRQAGATVSPGWGAPRARGATWAMLVPGPPPYT